MGALASRPRLFRALELALPVAFAALPAATSPDAIVDLDGPAPDPPAAAQAPAVPTISFEAAPPRPQLRAEIRVGADPSVDRRLHGITLRAQTGGRALCVDESAEDVLASAGSRPIWTRSRANPMRQRVAAAVPELAPSEVLRIALLSDHGLGLLALANFLRGICAERDFRPPPLRAAIVFDDPNLRRPGYGFINFRQLVEHSDRHGYHAVMAMVPHDAAASHPHAVALFRARPDRVSLAVHGNSHTREELLVPREPASASALCAQALRRVGRFEARTGLHVDRVMNPPHGRCSESTASALAALGFDALCAIHPEPWSQEPDPDRLLSGWGPATFAGPVAVIPRVSIHAPASEIALRAFMGNPVVLYGHHDDLAGGLDLLAQTAAVVNGLGRVHWGSLATIARHNVSFREQDGTVLVRPYAARTRLRLSPGLRNVVVEAPANAGDSLRGWSAPGATAVVPFGTAAPCGHGGDLEICLRPATELDPMAVPPPGRHPWAVLRRVATEARDRAMPLSPVRRMAAAERVLPPSSTV